MPRTVQKTMFYLWAGCVGIEVLLFAWLSSLETAVFMGFISTPDTPEYVRVALHLADTSTVTPSPRTIGYSVFLAFGYVIGGLRYGPYFVILVQLLLNLAFTLGVWRLLEHLAPDALIGQRIVATFVFFWAGLGLATYLMTDFLASLFFGIFLYGMLFWRTPSSVVWSGISLALATVTRPTFTYIPFLLPLVSYLIGGVTSRVPRRHVLAFAAFSMAATGLSTLYQYTSYGYLGPSPILITPIAETLYHGVVKDQATGSDYVTYRRGFEAEVAERAGRRFETLSPGERDAYAKEIFREELIAHPAQILANYLKNFVKYVFVPVESIWLRLTGLYFSDQMYVTYVRPLLGIICLPVWLLSLIPPIGTKSHKTYYLLAIVLLVYVVGLSAIGTGSGERIRFPVLAFMLPVTIWNIRRVHDYLSGVSPSTH